MTTAFVEAAREWGMPANDDFNGAEQDGAGFYQLTQRAGRRWSAADAYLHPAAGRANLTIQTDSLVTGVEFEGGRAAGVRYLRRGTEELARADGEVILAAGAVGSPQLLMLSGVGPADHLAAHRIWVIADSPGVGENLSDHAVVPVLWHTPKSAGPWEKAGPRNLARWRMMHSGPLTTNLAEAGGFSRSTATLAAPDLQWHAVAAPFRNAGLADPSIRALSVLIAGLTPASRGRIRLRSADPRHKPAIDPGYLSDGADIDPLVRGIQAAREIAGARAMARICKAELAPGPGRDHRGGAARVHPPGTRHAVPPGRHLRDGRGRGPGCPPPDQRGRPPAAGPRGGRAARGGRLGDAHRAAGQHERAGDRHRRAGRRPDHRPRPAGRDRPPGPGHPDPVPEPDPGRSYGCL